MNNEAQSGALGSEAIKAAAAAWLAQQEVGFTSGQEFDFARWCAADPRHAEAVDRIETTRGILEKMPLLRSDPQFRKEVNALTVTEATKTFSFGSLRTVLVAAAVLAIAATGWWIRPSPSFNQGYTTTKDGYQRVTLPDSSVMELNADTAMQVRYSANARHITLLHGEAHFTVAKNPERPFIVTANKISVRAIGTAFNVRVEDTAVEVLVTHGKVQVRRDAESIAPATSPDRPPDNPVISAGHRAVIPVDVSVTIPSVEAVRPSAIQATLAWQAPRLVFVETPLRDVVELFNRRNRIQLVLGDTELGARAVGGSFRADSVESFVRLLESGGDVAVERPDPEHLVLRKVR